MPDVLMPRLSDSMEEGTILRWLRSDGDAVTRGDELAEIETDKATETYAAEAEGVLRIVAGEGATLPLGAVIATLDGLPAASTAEDGAVGDGPPPAETGTIRGDVAVDELSRAQHVVVRRVAEAKATVPEFFLQAEVDMAACARLRDELRGRGAAPLPTYGDMAVKAAARALRDVPRANGAYRDGRFERYTRVNVGVAVADGDVLAAPTVFDADRKGLGEIARETAALGERVRAGTITNPELGGATFTVHDLGAFGVTRFAPIVHAPQAAVLGVGAVREVPVVRDGAVVPGTTMELTLVCDHRILHGATAAALLSRVRELLEDPAGLAL